MGKKLPLYNDKPYDYPYDKDLDERKITFKIFIPIAHVVLHVKFRHIEVHGLENIPDTGRLIVAPNHMFGLDPGTVAYAMRGHRNLFFMAKEEFFHVFYVKYLILLLNAFPIKRGSADRSAIDFAIRQIKRGFGLIMFPQGTRDKEHKRPDTGKSGIALIARESKADVLPVSIYPKEIGNGKKRLDVVIRFGKVIPYEDLGFSEDEMKSRELKVATKLIMEKIGELWDIDDNLNK